MNEPDTGNASKTMDDRAASVDLCAEEQHSGSESEMEEEVPQDSRITLKEEGLYEGAATWDSVHGAVVKSEPEEDEEEEAPRSHVAVTDDEADNDDDQMDGSHANTTEYVIDIRPSGCEGESVPPSLSIDQPRPVHMVKVLRLPRGSNKTNPELSGSGAAELRGLDFPELSSIVKNENVLGVCGRDIKHEQEDDGYVPETEVKCEQADDDIPEVYGTSGEDGEVGDGEVGSSGDAQKSVIDIKPSGPALWKNPKVEIDLGSFTRLGAFAEHTKPGKVTKSMRLVKVVGLPFKIDKIVQKSQKLIMVKQSGAGNKVKCSDIPRKSKPDTPKFNINQYVVENMKAANAKNNMNNVHTPQHKTKVVYYRESNGQFCRILRNGDSDNDSDENEKSQNAKPASGDMSMTEYEKLQLRKSLWKKDPALAKYYRVNRGTRSLKKPMECLVCGEVAKNMMVMEEHVQIHVGDDKPFKCKKCEKAYSEHDALQRHTKIHTVAKSYACDQCDLRFRYPNVLNKHMRVHSGERPFKCPICDKGYKSPAAQKRHINTHAGEKPYECPVCKKCFTQQASRNLHMVIHGAGDKHLCDVCGKQFNQKNSLLMHLRTHEKEQGKVLVKKDSVWGDSSG